MCGRQHRSGFRVGSHRCSVGISACSTSLPPSLPLRLYSPPGFPFSGLPTPSPSNPALATSSASTTPRPPPPFLSFLPHLRYLCSHQTNQLVSVGAAAFSFVCCTAVLLSAAWVWTVPRARNFLDRVSFRLLLCCLFWEIIYDINYISVSLGLRNRGERERWRSRAVGAGAVAVATTRH